MRRDPTPHIENVFRAHPHHSAAGAFLACAGLVLLVVCGLLAPSLPAGQHASLPQEEGRARSEQTTLLRADLVQPGSAVLPAGTKVLDRLREKQPDRTPSPFYASETRARSIGSGRTLLSAIQPMGFLPGALLPLYRLHRALLI